MSLATYKVHYVNFDIGYGKISVYYKEYKWR
ncbi:hypothetical protein J2X82_005844 [Priestia megaterium]|nr:hypothetical protein [Priestia megaterium]